MRKCHVCGLEVDDGVYICPDCGAEIVGNTGGLSLKAGGEEKRKKTGASLGTTVSTGSGLTDLLRGEDDSSEYMGSMPNAVSYDLTDYESDKKAKTHIGKYVSKLILLAVLAFGIYMLITQVLMKKSGPESYQEALDTYIEAINESDQTKMEFVTPAFFTDKSAAASDKLESVSGLHIDSYEIEDTYFLTSTEISSLQDSIKYATSKTANMTDVVNLRLKVSGDLGDLVRAGVNSGEITVQVVCIRNYWYVLLDTYEDIKFN
jgi:translation elongation factor EF-1beta